MIFNGLFPADFLSFLVYGFGFANGAAKDFAVRTNKHFGGEGSDCVFFYYIAILPSFVVENERARHAVFVNGL